MLPELPDFRPALLELNPRLAFLRQNFLLTEGGLQSQAARLGIPPHATVPFDLDKFLKEKWIEFDNEQTDGNFYFHPFRILVVNNILTSSKLKMMTNCPPELSSTIRLVERAMTWVPDPGTLRQEARFWNSVVDLAVLLEPLYWPMVTGVTAVRPNHAYVEEIGSYKQRIAAFVSGLASNIWEDVHSRIRRVAASLDPNSALYLLLRVSTWKEREHVEGSIGGAMWIRPIGEVRRRAFEEIHGVTWPEEDCAYSHWGDAARARHFGSKRPLDDAFRSKAHLSFRFGLFTGSALRWYVEGPTEYGAFKHLLRAPERFGIELVNLKGAIKAGNRNIAMTLQDGLIEDKALRRFSHISFDADSPENVKTVRLQIGYENVVGLVFAHDPDFEFANFSLKELVNIASEIDLAYGFSPEPVQKADWSDVFSAHELEKRYCRASERKQKSLKGEDWGKALAVYADRFPTREGIGEKRPMLEEVSAARRAWDASYDVHVRRYRLDPMTFTLADR